MRRSLPGIIAVLSLFVALPSLAQPEMQFSPLGPGSTFASIEAAAADGLAWAHKLQRESRNPRLSRGGTIVLVDSRYSYGVLLSASAASPDSLEMQLGSNVVAHFHTYPRQGGRIDRSNETHSRADRWVVDQMDSRRRPSFVLTPSLRVIAYHGRGEARTSDVFVAKLTQPADGRMLAAH